MTEYFYGNIQLSSMSMPVSHPVDDIGVGGKLAESTTESEICNMQLKAQIANHPLYPRLLAAYIHCREVGASPEMASIFDEVIIKETSPTSEIGEDPELDQFMESYCEILERYKEELSKPFVEATSFLSDIESQLGHLCKETLTTGAGGSRKSHSDEAVGTSEEDVSCSELETVESQESSGGCAGEQDLKEMLLRKYSGYLSCLKKEFMKKKKKAKLPNDARAALQDWWNSHYKWPYPTEEEKAKLIEVTGLDQKQINNWFINQRKRHWRQSKEMTFALMEGVSGIVRGPVCFDTVGGNGSIDV